MMHTPDHENDPWDTASPAEIRQDLIDYAQPPADTRPTPAIGLFQFTPNAWVDAHANLRETFRKAGAAATTTAREFEHMAVVGARARRRERLHQEAAAALGRGDRKTHKRKLAELRTIERKH